MSVTSTAIILQFKTVLVDGSNPSLATYVMLTATLLDMTANHKNQKHHEKLWGTYSNLFLNKISCE